LATTLRSVILILRLLEFPFMVTEFLAGVYFSVCLLENSFFLRSAKFTTENLIFLVTFLNTIGNVVVMDEHVVEHGFICATGRMLFSFFNLFNEHGVFVPRRSGVVFIFLLF
jgi:hypothetical protein